MFRRRVRLSAGCALAASLILASPTTAAPIDPQVPSDGPAPPATQTRDRDGHVTVRAVRVDTAPRIDAVLDESIYRTLTPISGFVQQEPSEGQPATEPTLVWILYDDRYLYVAARCRDS